MASTLSPSMRANTVVFSAVPDAPPPGQVALRIVCLRHALRVSLTRSCRDQLRRADVSPLGVAISSRLSTTTAAFWSSRASYTERVSQWRGSRYGRRKRARKRPPNRGQGRLPQSAVQRQQGQTPKKVSVRKPTRKASRPKTAEGQEDIKVGQEDPRRPRRRNGVDLAARPRCLRPPPPGGP